MPLKKYKSKKRLYTKRVSKKRFNKKRFTKKNFTKKQIKGGEFDEGLKEFLSQKIQQRDENYSKMLQVA